MPIPSRRSLAFGLDRISLVALRHPRVVAVVMLIVLIVTGYGITQTSVDRDLRNMFRGDTDIYQTYAETADLYVDPENQALVLIEGADLGEPQNFSRLRDLHLDLSLLQGVGSVFSLFSLRAAPDANGNTAPLVTDPSLGLDPALIAAIRAHPILGQNVLSEDGSALLFVVTHEISKAPLEEHDALVDDIRQVVDEALDGTGLDATVAGFAPMRTEIVRLLQRDQFVINGSGVIVGFLLSFILFRSLLGAMLTGLPAALAGATVLGWTAAFGIEATILSTVVPALVLVLGYADGMHLTASWRRLRQEGHSVLDAERITLRDVGPACMLTALTTSVAFLSMTLSDIGIVRDFGWIGAFGAIIATIIVLVGHGLLIRLVGHRWRVDDQPKSTLIGWLSERCAALAQWVTGRAWAIAFLSIPAAILFGIAFLAVPPEHSLSATLTAGHPMLEAFDTIDEKLGGAYPVQIIVPLDGMAPDSPEGLAQIRAVHEAVAALATASPPLSLWSLAEWANAGGGDGMALFENLPEETQRLFFAEPGAMVSVNIVELPTAEVIELIDQIEEAVMAVAPDAILTGATVMGAREASRTIGNLNLGLGLAVVVALALVSLALRTIGAGIVAAIPNLLPIFAVGGLLLVLGQGMQLTSVVSLTIAFGIAVDDTIHYLNAVYVARERDLRQRLIEASRKVGPVLIGTTFVMVGGLAVTQTSGLATIALFGLLVASSLTVAVISDLVVLPAIIAGPARRLFRRPEE